MNRPIQELLAPARIECERRADGTLVLRNPEPLEPYARCVGEWIERWAASTPDAIALGERVGDDWRTLTWAQLRQKVRSIAQGLLDLGLARTRPVVVLSDNSIEHALLLLGAMHIGMPVCTISSAYSKLAKDHARLRGMVDVLRPALVFASDVEAYGRALESMRSSAPLMVARGELPGSLQFRQLLQARETEQVQAAFDAIDAGTHAKYLLTSGSTGTPKVVVSTHGMLCANQQMIAQVWRFLDRERPVLCDWLPWSHTFGGSHNFNLVLRNGGTLFIDDGKPTPAGIARTVQNLRATKPNLLFNVPRGFEMMLPLLEGNATAAAEVFANLRVVFYAAAALPQSTWSRLEALSGRVKGEKVWLTTGYGSTETAPAATTPHWPLEAAGCIGAPYPGLEMKLAPAGEKLEIRLRGVSVFPGYLEDEAKTREAFDDEGFYRMGDAGRLIDESLPELGVLFDGRVAEDFKLLTGTWVSVGTLRPKLLSSFSPYAQDLVIAGHDRDEIGLLMFPTEQARCLDPAELEAQIKSVLGELARAGGGSSQVPTRVLLVDEPPSIEAGEITDKGYINQRAVLQNREADVRELFTQPASARVITAGTRSA
jgi:feruloyl-CoA synthase